VIASDVGYGSEAAFSRAFKKLVGTPPAVWRRRQGTSVYGAIAERIAPL
jgi:AraC-like DNA-binding protein